MNIRMNNIIDRLTGNRDEMLMRYSKLNEFDRDSIVDSDKNRLLRIYILIISATCLFILIYLVQQYQMSNVYDRSGETVTAIRRDDISRSYVITARIGDEKHDISLVIGPSEDGEQSEENPVSDYEGKPDYREEIMSAVRNDPSREKIVLPDKLSDGTKVSYTLPADRTVPVLLCFSLILMLLVYRMRYEKLERREREARASISMELPQFINKMTLLLNGGIVIDDCINKIIIENRRNRYEDSYFYDRMDHIDRSVRNANTSYINEMIRFARDSGVSEFIRICNILQDGVTKGANMVDRLENESEFLWNNRKARADELGKLAETRLTLPLMLLLLSLIVITIAPAMLRM